MLLEEVDVDFVVWEIHGRHDYKYTATAERVSKNHHSHSELLGLFVLCGMQARCLRTPQTWSEMLENTNETSEAWNPEVHVHIILLSSASC